MKIRLLIGLAVAGVINVCVSLSAHAATIPVTVTTEFGTPTDCTLRDAAQAANTNTAVNGCPAGEPSPVVDTIQLATATYDLSTYAPGMIDLTEGVRLIGQGRTQTRLVTAGDARIRLVPDALQTAEQDYMISELGVEGMLNIWLTGTSRSNISVSSVRFTNNGLFIESDSTARGAVAVNDVELVNSSVGIRQHVDSHVTASLQHIDSRQPTGGTAALNIYTTSTDPGDVVVSDSTFDGTGHTGNGPAISNVNTSANNIVTIRNVAITSYPIAIDQRECGFDPAPYTMYIENSSIGGSGSSAGVVAACGHLVVRDTTFHDIVGSAIVMGTNTYALSTTYSSWVEVSNSTFTRITPTLVGGGYGRGIIEVMTNNADPLPNTSSLSLIHNTFAGNTLGSYPVVAMTGDTVLQDLTVKNNAIEGLPISGAHTLSGTADVSHNLTTTTYTGPYASGFKTVPGFVLGALADNGGKALIGYQGRGGRVQTMRPLYGSPLIDGAPSAGLTGDQRGGMRSVLGAYDVGAVEVTLAEYTADGGVWNPAAASINEKTLANTGLDTRIAFGIGVSVVVVSAAIGLFSLRHPTVITQTIRRSR